MDDKFQRFETQMHQVMDDHQIEQQLDQLNKYKL